MGCGFAYNSNFELFTHLFMVKRNYNKNMALRNTRFNFFIFIFSSVLSFLLHKKQRLQAVRELKTGSEKKFSINQKKKRRL